MNSKFLAACIGLLLQGVATGAPQIEQLHLENGIKTLFVAAPELPMLDIAVLFDAGSGRDGKLAGLAQLTHGLLSAGSGELDADAIARKFEDVGALFGVSVNLDRSSVTLRSLSDEKLFNQALSTFIAVLTQPSFPDKDFQRLKRQTLVAIKGEEQRPGDIASKAFYKAIYEDHPYAHPTLGYRESIDAITLSDVKKFHQQYLIAENASITIVGGIDTKKARQIAQQITTGLATGKKPVPIAKPAPVLPAADIFVPYPSQQSHIFLGQIGIARSDPDYFTLYTGNHVLGGGGFTSRLVKEVRVARGLSYSVYSYFFPMQLNGPYILGMQTRTDQAQQALEVSLEIIEKLMDEGVTEEELKLSKNNIIGGFPLRIDSNRDVLAYLSLIAYYNLPLDYLDTFTAKISAVSENDIRAAFKKHLKLDTMAKIVVGGKEKK